MWQRSGIACHQRRCLHIPSLPSQHLHLPRDGYWKLTLQLPCVSPLIFFRRVFVCIWGPRWKQADPELRRKVRPGCKYMDRTATNEWGEQSLAFYCLVFLFTPVSTFVCFCLWCNDRDSGPAKIPALCARSLHPTSWEHASFSPLPGTCMPRCPPPPQQGLPTGPQLPFRLPCFLSLHTTSNLLTHSV